MVEKLCGRCGHLNAAHANFCYACGSQEFTEVQGAELQDTAQGEVTAGGAAVCISTARILVLTAVTSGLYFLYWLYATWKQLQDETKEAHFPVWHALTMFVPVYGLFRIHRHVAVIQALAQRVGVSASLTPGLAVVLVALNGALGLVSASVNGLVLVLFNVISFALTVTVMVLAQSTLNGYWFQVKGTGLQNMPMGVGERVLILVGAIIWLMVLWDLLA